MNISNFTEIKHKGVVIYCYYGKPLDGKYGVESGDEEIIFDTLEEAKQFIEGENNINSNKIEIEKLDDRVYDFINAYCYDKYGKCMESFSAKIVIDNIEWEK